MYLRAVCSGRKADLYACGSVQQSFTEHTGMKERAEFHHVNRLFRYFNHTKTAHMSPDVSVPLFVPLCPGICFMGTWAQSKKKKQKQTQTILAWIIKTWFAQTFICTIFIKICCFPFDLISLLQSRTTLLWLVWFETIVEKIWLQFSFVSS